MGVAVKMPGHVLKPRTLSFPLFYNLRGDNSALAPAGTRVVRSAGGWRKSQGNKERAGIINDCSKQVQVKIFMTGFALILA